MGVITQIAWKDKQPGDIGVVRHPGKLISEAIMAGEKLAREVTDGQAWSHVYIVGDGNIIEAVHPKVCLSPWDVYKDDPTAIFRLPGDSTTVHQDLLWLIANYVGRGYDLKGCVLGMGEIELLRALCLPADNNRYASQQTEWCSELGVRWMQRRALPSLTLVPTDSDPQQVYNLLRTA